MWFAFILWAILIIFIAECVNPGFIWMVLGSCIVYGILYFGAMQLINWIKTRKK